MTSAAQAIGDLFKMSRDDENSVEPNIDPVTGMLIREDHHAKERRAKQNGERKKVIQ